MKSTAIAIIVAAALIGGAIMFAGKSSPTGADTSGSVNNVSVVDGKQVIEISAKGGYSPKRTIAKAGIPTVLRMETNGTFDCSSVVRVPSLGLYKNLPPSGSTDIDVGTPQAQSLQVVCGMGMYSFQVDFQG